MSGIPERLERWIKGQRIGLASYAYSATPGRFREQEDLFRLLGAYLQDPLLGPGWSETRFLRQLSPSSLTLIRRAISVRGRLPEFLRPVVDAHEWLVGAGTPAPFTKAQIWAHHLLLGASSATQLARLGKSLFGGVDEAAVGEASWHNMARDEGFLGTIDEAINVLRAPQSRTRDRLEAVVGIRFDAVGAPPSSWYQIENLLIEYQLGWPLLVAATREGEPGIGLSLPVAVDVEFDGERFRVQAESDGMVDLREWRGRLTRCAEVGRQLWRSKRGNYGDFREAVARSRIDFDFTLAQEIGRDLHGVGFRIAVDGGSADTYLTQMVLSRLLGRRGLMGSAITGAIGERMVAPVDQTPLLNYQFTPPGGIREKLDYIFATHSCQRAVLPVGTEVDVEGAMVSAPGDPWAMSAQTAEVIFAHNQQIVADAVQGKQWRQYQYVRCPELVWGIHGDHRYGRPLLLPVQDTEVASVLASLARNQDDAVLELNAVRPVAVASALWHIHLQREALIPRVPPMLSWAFVRLLENEQDSLFWRLLWNITGASVTSFQEFLRSVGRTQVVSAVADALNRFEPTAECPGHRAPDILVLVRARQLINQENLCDNPLSRPFMVWPVIRELRPKGILAGPFDEAYRPFVGKTRIVVISEEAEDQETGSIPDDLDRIQHLALRILSVFEWGFTLHAAALVLSEYPGFERVNVREEVCLPLVNRKLLRIAEGRYHIPGPMLRVLRHEVEREGPALLAKLHYHGGTALASFASRTDLPGLALDTAFSPENISEAERLLGLAIRYAREGRNEAVGVAAKAALNRVTRYLRAPHWGVVSGFLQSGELIHDAHEIAEELIAMERAAEPPVHPHHLVLAGRAAAVVSKQSLDSPNKEKARKLQALAETYYRQALDNCAAFPSEEKVNRVLALTEFASHLARYEAGRGEEVERLSEEVLSLLEQGVSGRAARGDWFELMGDRETDHVRAHRLYRAGTRAVPSWAQLWLKALGSAELSDKPELLAELAVAMEQDLPRGLAAGEQVTAANRRQRQVLHLLKVTGGSYQRERRGGANHVRERWEAALNRVESMWPNDPRVRAALVEMRRPKNR